MGSPIDSRRADFDLPADEVFLDGAYMSPLPKTARPAVERAYEWSSRPYLIRYRDFRETTEPVREAYARVLGAAPEEVGVTTSCGHGAMIVANGLTWRDGDRVLVGPDEFPSNVYPWLTLRERGVSVEFVGERGRALRPEQLQEAFERPGRVRLLAVAASYYLTGDLHPLESYARLLHEREAWLVVDGTQAAACTALDWRKLGVDALLCGGYKWFLGPYGSGCVWMPIDNQRRLRDVVGNWWANERADDLTELLTYAPIPVHGRRFDTGETASFLNLAAIRAGLEYVLSIGVPAIERHHRTLQDRLARGLDGPSVRPLTRLDDEHRGPMFYLETGSQIDGAELQQALAEANVRVSLRGGRIRVSPGVWNDERDIDALLDALHRVGERV